MLKKGNLDAFFREKCLTKNTDPVVDILKEYVPEEKFAHAADTLCVCIENTKYAVFEQGFLRGIAAEKGGNM